MPAGSDPLLGTQIGSWRLTRLIGAGGMGRVYLGVQPDIGGRVAIKVLKDATDPELVERFFNEARAVNLIRHEGIVDVIDLGRLPDKAPYIVMEYLEGAPLKAFVTRAPRPHAGAMARAIADVLAALEAAHAKGIVHRDLKPDNIFLSPGGRVTVLDFGIAKLARELPATPTVTGGLLGTPAYMSPEQARAQPVDARSDLYSAGVILYEAATGELPFTAPSLYELLDQHVRQTPRAPRELDPAIPEPLEAVIVRALAKDPADRFASAAEMRAAISGAIAHLPAAELQLPAIDVAVRRPGPLDPGARTQASVAFAETRDSAQPEGRSSAPSVDTVRANRPLIAAIAGTALLGLLGVAFVVLRDRESARAVVPAAIDAASLDAPTDAPPDAVGAATTVLADAPPVDAPIDAPIDAAPRITRVKPRPPDFSNGPIALVVPNPSRFDPVAFYKTALAKARWAAEGPVQPTKIAWRHFDRNGFIDVSAGGSAEYFFAMLAPKTSFCYVLVIVTAQEPRISVAKPTDGSPCTGGIAPPRCTLAQLWDKAIADGAPASATRGTMNKLNRRIAFTVEGDDNTHFLVDDCR